MNNDGNEKHNKKDKNFVGKKIKKATKTKKIIKEAKKTEKKIIEAITIATTTIIITEILRRDINIYKHCNY